MPYSRRDELEGTYVNAGGCSQCWSNTGAEAHVQRFTEREAAQRVWVGLVDWHEETHTCSGEPAHPVVGGSSTVRRDEREGCSSSVCTFTWGDGAAVT
jgi:hypothetical protein